MRFRVHLEADWAELHRRDRMMTIPALRRSRQTYDVPGLYLAEHPLELHRGEVMALVNDHLTVRGHETRNGILAHETLDHRDVDAPGLRPFSSGDLPDGFLVEPQKQGELREPLIKERLSVDEDQRAACARGHEVGPNDCLPDSWRRDEHARVVREYRASRRVLDGGQLALEANVERSPRHTLVGKIQRNAVHAEELFEVDLAAARKSHMLRQILGACDHARRHRRREAHALFLVKLGVLECGKTLDLIDERCR